MVAKTLQAFKVIAFGANNEKIWLVFAEPAFFKTKPFGLFQVCGLHFLRSWVCWNQYSSRKYHGSSYGLSREEFRKGKMILKVLPAESATGTYRIQHAFYKVSIWNELLKLISHRKRTNTSGIQWGHTRINVMQIN